MLNKTKGIITTDLHWRPIHTERKRKFSLMFVVYSLICFTCSSIFLLSLLFLPVTIQKRNPAQNTSSFQSSFKGLFRDKLYFSIRKIAVTRLHSGRMHACLPGGGGGVSAWGVSAWGSAQGGVGLSGGLPKGCTFPRSRGRPPWTELLTHACENIIFP